MITFSYDNVLVSAGGFSWLILKHDDGFCLRNPRHVAYTLSQGESALGISAQSPRVSCYMCRGLDFDVPRDVFLIRFKIMVVPRRRLLGCVLTQRESIWETHTRPPPHVSWCRRCSPRKDVQRMLCYYRFNYIATFRIHLGISLVAAKHALRQT